MQLEPVIFQVDFGIWTRGQIAGFTPAKVRDLCNATVKGPDGHPMKVARIPTQEEVDADKKATTPQAQKVEEPVGVIIVGPNVAGYNPGDIAGFPPSVAADLVKRGAAKEYVPPEEDDAAEVPVAEKAGRRGPMRSTKTGEAEVKLKK